MHKESICMFIRLQVCARAISVLLSHLCGWNAALSLPVISTQLHANTTANTKTNANTNADTVPHTQYLSMLNAFPGDIITLPRSDLTRDDHLMVMVF